MVDKKSTSNVVEQNEKTFVWKKHESENSNHRPSSREGFVFSYMQDKKKFILLGGISHVRYSDIYTLCALTWKWSKILCKGESPKDVCYCASWYDCPNLYVSVKEVSNQETYILDTDCWEWYKLFTLETLDPRFHHTAVKLPNQSEAIVFGGFGVKQNKCLNDINKLDYSK